MTNITKKLPTSFGGAMHHFFGLKPGQKITDFKKECDALTDEDKAYFRAGLIQNGYPLEEAEKTEELAKAA